MKTRLDFVSNSSSCSFFVCLQSQADLDELKKLFGSLKNAGASLAAYSTAFDADCHANAAVLEDSADAASIGDYVLCDVGEDHDSWYERRYNDMCRVFDSSGHEFKFFEDPWAHMTRGEALPVEEEQA